MINSISYEEFCDIFQQLKNGFESIAFNLSEEDGDTLIELFERLKILGSDNNMFVITCYYLKHQNLHYNKYNKYNKYDTPNTPNTS